MNTTVKKPVGVVGLGAMGMGVAMSLLREGFEVHACDVRPEAVQKVVDAGGIAAASPAPRMRGWETERRVRSTASAPRASVARPLFQASD